MSRDILCKAKRTDNGEWVEGFYFCMIHNDGRHAHHFIIPLGADLSLGTPIEKIQVEVSPSTICQYTGLKDATQWENLTEKEQQQFLSKWNYKENRWNQKEDWNGKKIYENDIASRKIFENEVIGTITWTDIGFTGFTLKVLRSDDTRYFPVGRGTYDDDESKQCSDEVIGNIFDNHESLEGKERK